MRNFLLFFFILTTYAVKAQIFTYYLNDKLHFIKGNDTLQHPFTGGFVAPQFSSIDLNNDGVKDLVVFDRSGNKLMTFLNRGVAGQVSYQYDPRYEEIFPPIANWMLLRDYNCDGLEDIFCATPGSGFSVYKNTGTPGAPVFTHVVAEIIDVDGINLYCMTADIPAIDDVDGDGDLDILSFGVLGGYAEYYRNERVEKGYHCDSLVFKFVDYCWGSFLEGGLTNDIFLGDNCFGLKYYKNSLHAGSTLLTLDGDGDGDKELILGDVDYGTLKYLKNGKKETNWPWDTITSVINNYPDHTVPVDINKFPAAFYLDINNDGKKDFIAASNEPQVAKNLNQIWYYKNVSSGNQLTLEFADSSFLQAGTVDHGSMSKPVFYDVDGDGDLDLLLMNRGNYLETLNARDRVALYENVGNTSGAVFKFKEADYLNFSRDSLSGLHFTFGDLDQDGKTDIVCGKHNGKLRWYRNTGTNTVPVYVVADDELGGIDVGSYSTPFLYDVDKDNLPDLIIGASGGHVQYFRNRGTSGSPMFVNTPDADSVGRILVNDFFYKPVYDQNFNIIDSTREFEFEGFSVPWVADLDDDGNPELLVGSRGGKIFIHEMRLAQMNDSFPAITDYFVSPLRGNRLVADFGGRTAPAVMDMNNDGTPDILIGTGRGGLQYLAGHYEPLDSMVTSLAAMPTLENRLYPNPGSGRATLELNPGRDCEVRLSVLNILGEEIHHQNERVLGSGQMQLNLDDRKPGVYFIRVQAEGFEELSLRWVLIR